MVKPILLKICAHDIRGKQKCVVRNPRKIKYWKNLIDNGKAPLNEYKELGDV